jgi:hypothetical protein
MEKRDVHEVLQEWYPSGVFTEEDFWEAVAEADGYERDYYADGDIAEWL